MTWIKLGIVLFMLLQNVLSQQGYNYPRPDTPFPGGIPSPGKPGSPSSLDDTQESKTQSPGDYHSQPDRSGVPTNVLTPDGSAKGQGQSGVQGPSTGQRPVYPGQENNGSQRPSGNRPSSGNQQGYKYPAPQKPFSGTSSSEGQQNTPGYSNNKHTDLPSGGFPSSQQGFPKTNGYSGFQTPTNGQQSSNGYPGQQSTNSQLPFTDIPESSEYPDVSKSSTQFPAKFPGSSIGGNGHVNQGESQGSQPSGYPDVSKQSTQFPAQFPGNTIGGNGRVDQGESQGPQPFGKPSAFPDVGKPSSQLPSKFPGSATGGNGRENQVETQGSQPFGKPSDQNGVYPSGSPGYSQGKPQFSEQTNELPRPHGHFPDAETPRQQFPGSNRGPSTHGTNGADRDQSTFAGPGTSFGSSNGYTDNGPLGGSKFPSQQIPQGYPGAGSPSKPQFSTPGSVNQFQPSNQNGQETPEETGRPAGRFPGTTPTGPSRQGTQSQNGFQQRPSGDYLPPQHGSGHFPSPGKTNRPQFPTQGSRTDEKSRTPVDQPKQPNQPAFQSGNQYSRPANQGGDLSFPSNRQNKPASPFQRPEFPTSGQPDSSRILSPSGDSFRPEQSSGTDTSKVRPGINQAGDRPTSFPGSSGSQFGGPDGLQNQFPGQQDVNEPTSEDGDYSAIPGEPDVDYPVLSLVPDTSFKCEDQQFPGYYADVETRCQAFHVCANDKKYDFLCPNGTIFHQEYLVCVWWNQFDCSTAQSLYGINENIYDFSITGIQQTGGIPVPGSDFPSAQTPGGFQNQPQGPARPGAPGTKPSFPGQTQDNLDNGNRPGFPSGASRPHNGYPSGQAESNGYPTPGSATQGSRFPSSDSKTPLGQGPATHPSGRPQGPAFPSDSDRPNTPSFGQPQTQQSSDYPSQGSRFPSSSQQTGTQAPQDKYPADRPQRPGFPSGSQAPVFGQPQSQRPSGYPSGPDSQGSRFPTSGSTQTPSGPSQGPEGYPSGKPQGPNFPSSRPGTPAFGQPQSQQSGSYPSPESGKPQGPSFPSASDTPRTPAFGQPQSQRPGSYPSPGRDSQGSRFPPLEPTQSPAGATQEPEEYPRPQGLSFPSGSARPGTLFGQQPQQPSRYPSSEKDTDEPRFPSSSGGSKSQTPLEGYPSGRPQGSGFQSGSSRPQTPAYQTGSQSPSGYSSTDNGSQGSHFPPSGPGSQAQDSKAPGDYPTKRPQASFKPAFGAPGSPVSGTSQLEGVTQGYPRPQIPGSPAGRPQPSSGSNQGNNRYPSGTTEPRRPGGYSEDQPESYPSQELGSTPGSTIGSRGSPDRPRTPFPGSPQPHHPTREYLPPVSRK